VTIELKLDSFMVNQRAKYLGQKRSEVIPFESTESPDTHTGRTALSDHYHTNVGYIIISFLPCTSKRSAGSPSCSVISGRRDHSVRQCRMRSIPDVSGAAAVGSVDVKTVLPSVERRRVVDSCL